jgi:hypothetical protein
MSAEFDAQTLGRHYLVCNEAGASPFDDDLLGRCIDCDRLLAYRPYLPQAEPKLCRDCFTRRKNAAVKSGS